MVPASPTSSSATWPARGAICLDCRTTYPAGTTTCEAGSKHQVTDLRDANGREALVTEVWGPPSRRRKAREAVKAGGTGAAGGSAAEGCGACADAGSCGDLGCEAGGGEVAGALLVIAIAIIAAIAIYFIIKWIVGWYRRRKARLKPKGALSRAPSVGRKCNRIGVIQATETALAPITNAPAVAFSIVAKLKRHLGGNTTLRDGASVGFDVLLDSGERVRIPAGPVFIDMRGAENITSKTRSIEMGAYLAAVEGSKVRVAGDTPPIPYDRVEQVVLAPGMRVEVRGPMLLAPDGGAHGGGYRDGASAVFVSDGTPRLAIAKDA